LGVDCSLLGLFHAAGLSQATDAQNANADFIATTPTFFPPTNLLNLSLRPLLNKTLFRTALSTIVTADHFLSFPPEARAVEAGGG